MKHMSYRVKLLLMLLAMVVLLEAASYVATRIVIRDAVIEQAYNELHRGSNLFSQLMGTRARQLAQSVSVLTDDFGFKQAVASADAPTIRSALMNHAARVHADIALVLDNKNQLVASTINLPPQRYRVLQHLLSKQQSGTRYALVIINNTLYQFVLSPVKAPLRIGIAGVGFEVDQALSRHLKNLTDLEVSFVSAEQGQLNYLSGTLHQDQRRQLLHEAVLTKTKKHKIWRAGDMLHSGVTVAEKPQKIVAVLQVPLSRAMQPFSVLDTQLLSLTLSFFVVAAIVALFLARSVARPVRELAQVARRVARGDYNSPVKVKGADELGALATAITRMQSAIAEREQEIIDQAEHDSLTGLANRAQVFPQLQQAMEKAVDSGGKLLVMVADIYKFTQINDSLSPEVGDKVLRAVSERFIAFSQANSGVLRLGSDEFLLLVQLDDGMPEAALAQTLLQCLEKPIAIDDIEIKVELNIGYAVYPEQGESAELLLRRANLALNQARQSHHFICAYQSGWDEIHLRRLHLFGDFKQALLNNDITLYYQPKIDPNNKHNIAAEALIRWVHPEFGFVNPEEFISVIESAGQVSLLTRWVVRTALQQARDLKAQGIVLLLSVNLSALDLLEDDFPDFIAHELKQTQLPSSTLCLEITESAIMQEAERSLANLNRLHAMGLRISIDDYGTGYSSLSQMKQLPVYELKIDKSFVLNLDSSQDDQQIVKSTIELGHTLGLKVTAEGVETSSSRDWLIANGCDILQGYFYSKALPAREFTSWVTAYLAEHK